MKPEEMEELENPGNSPLLTASSILREYTDQLPSTSDPRVKLDTRPCRGEGKK